MAMRIKYVQIVEMFAVVVIATKDVHLICDDGTGMSASSDRYVIGGCSNTGPFIHAAILVIDITVIMIHQIIWIILVRAAS